MLRSKGLIEQFVRFSKMTKLKDLIKIYISDILPRKKPQTQKMQKIQLAFWSKHLGKKEINEIKPLDIIQTRSLLKVSDASKNIYVAALRHVFTIAVKEFGLADSNPLLKVSNLKNPRGRVRFLSDEERLEFLISCEESSNPYLYVVVLIAIATGARKSEILTLKWSQIDFDRKLIFLEDTKNGDLASLILSEKIAKLLFEAFKESRSELVFKGKKNQPIDIRYPFEQARKRAKLENFTFHDLRHTCASYLAMNGATPIDIMEILRHSSMAMVKRYAHLSTAHKAGVLNSMVDKMKL